MFQPPTLSSTNILTPKLSTITPKNKAKVSIREIKIKYNVVQIADQLS
jgi:hypothetical protein